MWSVRYAFFFLCEMKYNSGSDYEGEKKNFTLVSGRMIGHQHFYCTDSAAPLVPTVALQG